MKRFGIIIALLVLLVIGGGLTTQLIANGSQPPLPVLQQVGNPDASANAMLGWKAEQLFLAIGFIISSLIGVAILLTVVFWLLDRGIRISKAEASAKNAAAPPAA